MGSDVSEEGRGGVSMRRAALIQFASRYVSVAVQLVITAVLARLITPEEFGTLAIVTVFTSFFTMFADMGVGIAIVQFRDLAASDFKRLFGFSFVLALVIGLVFCAASWPIALVYSEPSLVPLCCFASLALVFSTLNMVPNGIMLRERKFAQIGMRLVVVTVVSGAASIALAFLGLGCYALVAQNVVSALGVLLWNYASNPIGAPNFHFMDTLRRVFSYSAYQFTSALVNYFNRNLDNLLIGRVAGTETLGYYDKAYKLTTYPMTSFSSVIASVIHPFMAEHQDDVEAIFSCWLRIARLCSLVGAAVAALMFCCSEEIVIIMYGDQWLSSVPLLRALSVSVYAQMVGNPTGAFFQSLGRTDTMFTCGLVNTVLMTLGIVCGVLVGDVQTTAWLVSAAFFAQLVSIAHFLVKKEFGKGPQCLRSFVPGIVGGIVAAGVGEAVGLVVPHQLLAQLVCKPVAVACVLAGIYAATGQVAFLRSFVRR